MDIKSLISVDPRIKSIVDGLARLHWASRRLIDAEVKELCEAHPDIPPKLLRFCCEYAAREIELQGDR
jgi:hypothetical protein